MKQEMKLLLKQDVITGFSYSFTKALLEKLKKLKAEDRIFEEGETEAIEREKFASKTTTIAESVIDYLETQINPAVATSYGTPGEINTLISLTEEFLSIFEKQKK